jgi:hypothetical protein
LTHHHANVCLGLCVDCLVQHDVHELIKPTQSASNVPVGVERNCNTAQVYTVSKVRKAAAKAVAAQQQQQLCQ